MSRLQDALAQEIWQAYVIEVGRALPEGLADKMAESVVTSMGFTEETNAHYGDRYTDDSPATRRRFVGPWQNITVSRKDSDVCLTCRHERRLHTAHNQCAGPGCAPHTFKLCGSA
jgi:hypothetical protein